MERTADTLENCVTVLKEKSCEKQTACSDAELCTLYSALKYRIEVDQHGTRRYYNAAGRLHRVDGPAVEWPMAVVSGFIMDYCTVKMGRQLCGKAGALIGGLMGYRTPSKAITSNSKF